MKTVHIFDIDQYHQALQPKERFVSRQYNQRGAGLRTILGNFKRYSIPVLNRYVVPHAKEAVYKTYQDILDGSGIRSSIQRNTLGLLQDVGNDVINNLKQKGKGIRLARISHKKPMKGKPSKKKTLRKKVKQSKAKKNKAKKKSKKSKPISRRDIFS